jgi:hypothetical protein
VDKKENSHMNIQMINLDPNKKYAIGEDGGKVMLFELVEVPLNVPPPAIEGKNWTGYRDSKGQPLYVGDEVKVYINGIKGMEYEVSKITDFTAGYGHISIMGWATRSLEFMLSNYQVTKVS